MAGKRKRGDNGDNSAGFTQNQPLRSKDHEIASQSSLSELGESCGFGGLAVPSNLPFHGETATSTNRISADRQQLSAVFPEDVWQLIFEKLDNEDLVNLSNSSLFLRELLLPRRVEFMFQNVWGVVARRYQCVLYTSNIDMHQLLTLRLVCQSWNKGFGSFYQQQPLYQFEDKYDISRPSYLAQQVVQMNMSKRSVDKILTTAWNPFFARSIGIKIWNSDPKNALDKTLRILNMYGPQIWHCDITVPGDVGDEDDYYEDSDDDEAYNRPVALSPAALYSKMRSVLVRVPNLKTLHVKVEVDGTRTFQQLRILQNEINSNPLPHFKYLQNLSTKYVPSRIFNELIRQNSHVSTLEMRRWARITHANYDIYSQPKPNLSTLTIEFNTKEDFLRLTQPKVKWPLTKLDAEVYCYCGDRQPVFSVLHDKFGKTLTHLKLTLSRNEPTLDDRIYNLNLPNLTYLSLYVLNIACLDFLLPLRDSLTYLSLSVDTQKSEKEEILQMAEKVEKKSVIKLLSCAKSGSKSNIWDVLPKLQELNFSFRSNFDVLLKLNGYRKQCHH